MENLKSKWKFPNMDFYLQENHFETNFSKQSEANKTKNDEWTLTAYYMWRN